MKEIWVISLGGSRIVPDDVDYVFLKKFRALLDKHQNKKFVVVCGGGKTARRYINAYRKLGVKRKDQNLEGIEVTRFHAGFMSRFFGGEANSEVPKNMGKVKRLLGKNRVVFCGALRWRNNNTTDGNAAQLAGYLECSFINLTNVSGLYDKDPRKNKSAKLISKIGWDDFFEVAKKVHFEPGQHFVLDRIGSEEIRKNKTDCFIVGSLKDLDLVLLGKKFCGTLISG